MKISNRQITRIHSAANPVEFDGVESRVRNANQVTGQVDPWLIRALTACAVRPISSLEIQESTGLRHRETFQRNYLDQIISDGLVERTIPDKPTSRLQKYRLAQKGRELLERLDKEGGAE